MVDERRIADELLDYLVYAPVGALLTLVEDLPALANKGRSRVQGRLLIARSLGQFAVQIGNRRVQKVVKERVSSVWPRRAAPAPAAQGSPGEPPGPGDALDGGSGAPGRPGGGEDGAAVRARSPRAEAAGGRGGAARDGRGSPRQARVAKAGGAARTGATRTGATRTGTVGTATVTDTSSATGGGPGAGPGGAGHPVSAGSLAIPGYDSLAASQVVQRLGGLTLVELEAVGDYEAATRGRRTILGRIQQLSNPAASAVGAADDART